MAGLFYQHAIIQKVILIRGILEGIYGIIFMLHFSLFLLFYLLNSSASFFSTSLLLYYSATNLI